MKMSLSTTAKAIKRITLDDIYTSIEEGREKQEKDYQRLSDKIDSQIGEVKGEIGQVRGEIGEVRQEIRQTNQRIDTVMGMLINISQQILELSKQKKES
ncbi:MAG: hypothetical protein QG610_645 [Euryarchaeota archaeon]|nr:hypothetical protein [Euryarchaeota archaeon]